MLRLYQLRRRGVARTVLETRLFTPVAAYSTACATSAQELVPIDPLKAMPDRLVRQFQEDGAVVLRGVFDTSWVEAMRAAAEDNMADPGPLCDEHAQAQGTAGRFHDDQ
jgi:hypothetical protein|eukprot:COSAG02_NODE_501_length_21049_cov_34.002768_5_plen_109_part_00